ncbi:MAG TPA: hypothetical protein PKK06_16035 [Phycisphaerae bacterium]|nr:hypothetical protein [Phycisphaerae bacterium]HNU45017.1 hypothetical protein [Phycisphaerae bacterium]
MQSELDARPIPRAIHILGVNDVGLETGNAAMTEGRALPWLQAVEGEDAWALWQAEFRDVVILGPRNERIGVFNVTRHNLSEPQNYAALKDQLLAGADE